MKKSIKYLLLLVVILTSTNIANATHIVGGVMNYKYLGNDNYEISLFVYRDCYRAASGAYFDDPARIQVFTGNGTYYTQYTSYLDYDKVDTLPVFINDPCLVEIPDECVDWYKYTYNINLPFNPNGYIIAYNRCCRNYSILNLTNYEPDPVEIISWGATYTIEIPANPTSNIQNTSPVFNNYPPVAICANRPLVYDHSAFDADGDSLVYELCTPYHGASVYDPSNTTTIEYPPFDTIKWKAPYSLANLMGGVPLKIDPETGIMTATPNTQGQFVVGVCVKEYRNGRLLTRTIRDFQFNVGNCTPVVNSSFFSPNILCNGFTVDFTNQSSGQINTIKWYFGDGDSSTNYNPSHTYADTGIYNVTLVINQGTDCGSSFTKDVSIQYQTIDADFTTINNACLQTGDTIHFTDLSTDELNVVKWNWSFSTGTTDTVQNPFIIYNGTYTNISATLTVTSRNGCTSTISKSFTLKTKPVVTLQDSTAICLGASSTFQVSVTPNDNYTYQWSPIATLSNSNSNNPTANPRTNTWYFVTVGYQDAAYANCKVNDSILVKVEPLQIDILADSIKLCTDTTTLTVSGNYYEINWSDDRDFTTILGNDFNLFINQSEPIKKYFVLVKDNNECEVVDSIVVVSNKVFPSIVLADSLFFCGTSVSVNASINNYDSLIWSTNSNYNPIISTNEDFTATQNNIYQTYYIKAYKNGCSREDNIPIRVQPLVPEVLLGDTLFVCADSVRVQNQIFNYDEIKWSYDRNFTTIFSTAANFVLYQSEAEKMYYVYVRKGECELYDSLRVLTSTITPSIQINISQLSFCSNAVQGSANVLNYTNVAWYSDANFSNPISNSNSFNYNQTEKEKTYYIKANYIFCEVVDSITLYNNKILANINDTAVCIGNTITASIDLDAFYDYSIHWQSIDVDTTINGTSITYTPSASQWLSYTIINNFTCSSTDSIFITVYDLPSIQASADKDSIYSGETIQLEATQNNYSYQWMPSNAVSNTSIYNPTATPNVNTTYLVTVEDANGCFNQDSVAIYVKAYNCTNDYIYIPNAFTPNGDGVNDEFYVRSETLTEYHLIIFNRWGDLIFESFDQNNKWNGTYKGKLVQDEAYAYYFEGKCILGEKITLKGNITILK